MLENSEGRTSSASKNGIERATACLLTNDQKQKIRSSQCIRSNTLRDSQQVVKEDAFVANATKWPFVTFNPQNPLLTQRFVWRYRRAIDLGVTRIIGGRPINPHQFKFVVSSRKLYRNVNQSIIQHYMLIVKIRYKTKPMLPIF